MISIRFSARFVSTTRWCGKRSPRRHINIAKIESLEALWKFHHLQNRLLSRRSLSTKANGNLPINVSKSNTSTQSKHFENEPQHVAAAATTTTVHNGIKDPEPIDNVVSSSTTTASIMNALPPKAKSYAQLARFDKPIGTMLLLWPCFWSTALASGSNIVTSASTASSETAIISSYNLIENLTAATGDPKLLALFATGSFLMRGAGCTINDMWDAKYDKKVSRTATRPLASGALTYQQATGFLALQLTGGLGVLLSMPQQHLEYCFYLGAASLPLVGIYPLMKRYTNWPQLVLGMTFNWGCFMGWAATHGSLDFYSVIPLYLGSVCWTVTYDTLYAHQDKKDDSKLGLKSTALHFGQGTKPILLGFSTLATGNWMLAGYNLGYAEPFYYLGCGIAGSHLFWQVFTADLNNPKNLADRFKSNTTVGTIIFASCVAGNFGAML